MTNYTFTNGSFKAITAIPGWAEDYNNGMLTAASTPKAYMSSAWAFRAVTLRADAIAGAVLKLYNGDDEEIDRHPLLDLLQYVNAEWNRADLWRYTEAGTLVHGAGYWQKVRAGNKGQPRELFYVNPGTMKPEFDSTGIIGFTQQTETGRVTYDRQDIVYFRGAYDPASDLTGIPALQLAVQAAMAEANADSYLAAYFKNGAVPALLLTTDQQIDRGIIEQIREWWRRTFQGVGNQHKVGITGSGLKPVQIGANPKDLALSEVRIELHRSISTALGVPELLISPTNAADLTPVKMAERVFYSTTILPRWEWYAEVLNAELLPEYPELVRSGAYLAFDYSEIAALQEDTNEKAARLVSLVQAGIIKPEVAAEELGFEEDDVPEASETPEPVTPDQTDQTDQAMMDDMPDENTDAQADETKWRRKAEKAVKQGKPADVNFVSECIPTGRMSAIHAGLAQAKTLADVADVFAQPDPLTLLALELRRANDLLANTDDDDDAAKGWVTLDNGQHIYLDENGNYVQMERGGRAAGGATTIGLNNENYAGGQFLPMSEQAKLAREKAKKAKKYMEKKQEIYPYKWETPPTEDHTSLFTHLTSSASFQRDSKNDFVLNNAGQRIMAFDEKNWNAFGRHSTTTTKERELKLIEKYNNGQRWALFKGVTMPHQSEGWESKYPPEVLD